MKKGDIEATGHAPARQPRAGDADLSAVLAQCYAATLEPGSWPRIMAALVPLFGTTTALAIGVDRIFPSLSRTETTGLSAEVAAAIRNRDLSIDYIWQAVVAMPAGSVYRATELLPVDVLHQGALWDQIAKPAGLDFAMGAILDNTPGFFWNVCIMRQGRDFTFAEKALLERLLPHLQNCLRISLRIELGDAGRREALRSFDRARQAVVVLDRSGYAIYQNDAAHRVLAKANGVQLKLGRFVFQQVTVQGEYERALRLALQSMGRDISPLPHVVRVPRRGPGSPYALSVIALSSPSDRAVLPDGAGAMILVYDLELPNPLPVERLAWLYRLTPAEARVCDTIFRLGSVDSTAEELCLTRNTVRSHLKSIYSKFGVASQGQLMQRLANSLRLSEGYERRRGAS